MDLFYRDLLSHEQIAVFFKDDSHIKRLIHKQKTNFIESLDDSPEELKQRYVRLGKFHYDIRVPAVDFLRSTQMFRSNFIEFTVSKLDDITLIKKIDSYFRSADVHMCQGYLERQLSYDKADLIKLIEYYENPQRTASQAGLSHLKWLLEILNAIEKRDISSIVNLNIESCTAHSFLYDNKHLSHIPFDYSHLDDLHHRIHIDAKNLFYFIENDDYPEVLSLYSSLLSAYKITLIFLGNHALQLELNQTHTELDKARSTIKELEEIIPICSYCNKIRDDEGAWKRMEAYFKDRLESSFSHGICPTCFKKAENDAIDQ